MNCLTLQYQTRFAFQNRKLILICVILVFILNFHGVGFAEGTKQLEPINAPSKSLCRLTIAIDNSGGNRIPFALVDCSEEYRLNIHISNFTNEKIYFGFGNLTEYGIDPLIVNDVHYQVKDPAGNIVAGYALNQIPYTPSDNGFIETLTEAHSGPNINNSNQSGYPPLIIDPAMNGDYILEFSVSGSSSQFMRSFEYFDVTVANGNTPISGRLWSKAWQLSSGSVNSYESASYASFYIYSNDSIATSYDSNGLAGGLWTIYSNEWGCATTGSWSNRRSSVVGNASLRPQYKIFLNDPDPSSFPSGIIGEMVDAAVLPHVCDTVITFAATVSKAGNIEILIDVPPLNPNTFGPEDVQLGYSVEAGYNTLLPAWDAKDSYGIPLTNGTLVEARINFLNGLTNIPLYDVEDNPLGFIVNIVRPIPESGNPKLKLFWDDTKLPPEFYPTKNVIDGCEYSGIEPVTGCHEWNFSHTALGDFNTINSWWYYTTNNQLLINIELELLPRKGSISGPENICIGQQITFRTTSIPFAPKYIWHLSGPGISVDVEKDAPDSTFTYRFSPDMPLGQYVVSVYGLNTECGNGETVFFETSLQGDDPPPIIGATSTCVSSTSQVEIVGPFLNVQWFVNNGEILGSSETNLATILWHSTGPDTIQVYSTSLVCGTRISKFPIMVYPVANVGFEISKEATSCPGLPFTFTDTSELSFGTIVTRNWQWDDGLSNDTPNSQITHSFGNSGNYNVRLKVTTDQGCVGSNTSDIEVMPEPIGSFNYKEKAEDNQGILHFVNLTTGATDYYWEFGNGSTSTLFEPETLYTTEGEYYIMLVSTTYHGCIDTTYGQYYYLPGLWIPSAFSPDNNGINDIFKPITIRTTLDSYLLQIYNRWGGLLFNTTNIDQGWDGTYQGETCKAGAYIYRIAFSDSYRGILEEKVMEGTVTLVR